MAENVRKLKSDLARVDAMKDDDIDYSDIPEVSDEMFTQPAVAWPIRKEPVTIRLDADILHWLRAFGRGYQTRINQILRREYIVANVGQKPGATMGVAAAAAKRAAVIKRAAAKKRRKNAATASNSSSRKRR